MKGWVYVITNKAMPGLVKVGFSMKDPELRAAELNHTGSPHPYLVDYEVLVDDPRDIEQKVHSCLRNYKESKEWFRCTPEEAIALIKSVVGTNVIVENFKRAERAKAEAIRQKKEAEERARREAEEERRKRESILNSKRQEIISQYEPLLKEALQEALPIFWVMWIVFCVLIFVIKGLFPKMEDPNVVILSAVSSFIITPIVIPFVKNYLEAEAKESTRYQSILSKRDADLALIESEFALGKPNDHNRALKANKKVIEQKPGATYIEYNKGVELYRLGHYKEAIKAFEKAIELKPDDADIWYNKGDALHKLGRYEEAIKAFSKAREIRIGALRR